MPLSETSPTDKYIVEEDNTDNKDSDATNTTTQERDNFQNKALAGAISTAQIVIGLATTANTASPYIAVFGAGLSGSGFFSALYVLSKDPKNIEAKKYLTECLSGSVYQVMTAITTYLTKSMSPHKRIPINAGMNILATILSEVVKIPFTGKLENIESEKLIEAMLAGGFRAAANIKVTENTIPLLSTGRENSRKNILIASTAHAVSGAIVGVFTNIAMSFWPGKTKEKKSMHSQAGNEALTAAAAGLIQGHRTAIFGS